MKTLGILVLMLVSLQVYSMACRCTCDPMDMRLCASNYDLNRPCLGICPGNGQPVSPVRTACPMKKVFNELKGAEEWISMCNDNNEEQIDIDID